MLEQRLAVQLHHVAHLGGVHIIGALRLGLADQLDALLEAGLGQKPGAHLHHGGGEGVAALMSWPFACQQPVELACAVERVELVAAADMGLADEDLRKSRARAGAMIHLVANAGSVATSCSVKAAFLRVSSDLAALQ